MYAGGRYTAHRFAIEGEVDQGCLFLFVVDCAGASDLWTGFRDLAVSAESRCGDMNSSS